METKEIKQLNLTETLRKINHKIDNLAEAKGMTRDEFEDWCEAETQRQQLEEDEIALILAYQIDDSIRRLERKGLSGMAGEIQRKEYWIRRYKEHFRKVDVIFSHLTQVCAYWQDKYGFGYEYEWLVNWNETLFERIVDDISDKRKRKLANEGE